MSQRRIGFRLRSTLSAGVVGGAVSIAACVPPEPTPKASCALSLPSLGSTCESCFRTNCTAACEACQGDTGCDDAFTCFWNPNCTSSSCVSGCLSGLSTSSLNLLSAITSDPGGCIYASCRSECTTPSANGDVCYVSTDCQSGTCDEFAGNAGWCTVMNCTSNQQCGTNTAGRTGWCGAVTGGGHECFAGCTSSADCQTFQCGTSATAATCQSVTSVDGSAQMVCAC